ncbi:hypothetical protein BSLA_02f0453 [Burkholderia stabilis]|nr:hypothetical protein BSLA_02f0453 [Burkholderia stabilis]
MPAICRVHTSYNEPDTARFIIEMQAACRFERINLECTKAIYSCDDAGRIFEIMIKRLRRFPDRLLSVEGEGATSNPRAVGA